jgi:hypothetical protein
MSAVVVAVAVLAPTAAFAAWQGSFSGKSQAVTGVLGAPQSLTATVASATSVTLSWNSPTGVAATKYTVTRGGGTVQNTCAGSVTTTSCTDTGLTTGTQYTWSVKAQAGANWNGGTSSVSATPQLSLHVSAITSSSVARQNKDSWHATITVTVVDQSGAAVSGVTVTGSWSPTSGESGNCSSTTDASGQCSKDSNNSAFPNGTNETWSVSNVAKSGFTYNSAANVVSSLAITAP